MSGQLGRKFARILLRTHVQEGLARAHGGTGFSIGPALECELDDSWADWLGSIRMKQLARCNLVIETQLPSSAPEILDHESQLVGRMVNNGFVGLLLAKSFIAFAPPTLLIGGQWSGGSSVRQIASLPQPVHDIADCAPDIDQAALSVAVRLGGRLAELEKRKLWRLNRSLQLYRQARCEPNGLERLHQYVRTLEGATKPPNNGGTTRNFIKRMGDLAGEQHTDLFRRLYDLRGAVEHLREHEILADATREARLELVKNERIAEFLSRTILARIVGCDQLPTHFGTADAVDRFWASEEAERRALWGPPIDPIQGLQGFDPDLISNDQLSLPT